MIRAQDTEQGATYRQDLDGRLDMQATLKVQCEECERVFDLLDANENQEWTYGHDCEVA
jgi:hypothetical protein